MLLSSDVVFDGELPTFDAIASALNRRTGLTTTFRRHPKHGFIVVRCREVRPMIDDMSIHGQTITIEQLGWYGVYFFRELVGALVELGGRPTHGDVPAPPARWRDLPWRVRMIERHPFMASVIWLALTLTSFARRRRR